MNDTSKQYTALYGPFVSGDYAIGQQLTATDGAKGEVIWSYQSSKGLVYVLDDHSGWPYEVLAKDIIAAL